MDAQAESKKITDPDVVHIWKTNRYAHGMRVLSENVVAKMECVTCDQKSKILACLFGFVDNSNFSVLIQYDTNHQSFQVCAVCTPTSHSEKGSCGLRALLEAGCLTDVFAP